MDFDDTMLFADVIAYMDSGQPFALSFVSCDKKRKKAGEWIEIKSAVKFMALDKKKQSSIEAAQPIFQGVSKNPHHFENATRNIKLQNGELRKIHIRLIRIFNNKKVI
jgi:hypothetical protein